MVGICGVVILDGVGEKDFRLLCYFWTSELLLVVLISPFFKTWTKENYKKKLMSKNKINLLQRYEQYNNAEGESFKINK